jgi:hypothetical protein
MPKLYIEYVESVGRSIVVYLRVGYGISAEMQIGDDIVEKKLSGDIQTVFIPPKKKTIKIVISWFSHKDQFVRQYELRREGDSVKLKQISESITPIFIPAYRTRNHNSKY